MTPTLYQQLLSQIQNHPELSKFIKQVQDKLDKSNLPEYDVFLASLLLDKILKTCIDEEWEYHDQLLFDSDAMSPMPDSVHKQIVNGLIKTHNLNLLADYPWNEPLPAIDDICVFDSVEKVIQDYERCNNLWEKTEDLIIECNYPNGQKKNYNGCVSVNLSIYGLPKDGLKNKVLLDKVDALYNPEFEEVNYWSMLKCDKTTEAITKAVLKSFSKKYSI